MVSSLPAALTLLQDLAVAAACVYPLLLSSFFATSLRCTLTEHVLAVSTLCSGSTGSCIPAWQVKKCP